LALVNMPGGAGKQNPLIGRQTGISRAGLRKGLTNRPSFV
jgi:hypothetical protein